jgi:hypothetical protein
MPPPLRRPREHSAFDIGHRREYFWRLHAGEWEFGNKWKGDNNLRSFLFTLRNPYSVPPRKFVLKAEHKQFAICCHSAYCAAFGGSNSAISASNDCNANKKGYTRIATHWRNCAYANDPAFEDFLTGAEKFTVKEIAVFEIAD